MIGADDRPVAATDQIGPCPGNSVANRLAFDCYLPGKSFRRGVKRDLKRSTVDSYSHAPVLHQVTKADDGGSEAGSRAGGQCPASAEAIGDPSDDRSTDGGGA